MTFPGNDLEIVLQAASREQTGVASFVDRLFEARAFFPMAVGSDGAGSINVMTIGDKPYVALFTSAQQAEAAGAASSVVESSVRDFMAAVPGHFGLAVNPGGELGLPISAETVQLQLGRGAVVPPGTRIRIGEPAVEPVALLERMVVALGTVPAIREARRCWAQVGAEAPGLVVGVDLDPDNPDVRASTIRAIASADSEPGFTINVVFTNDRDEFTAWMMTNAEPFYSTR